MYAKGFDPFGSVWGRHVRYLALARYGYDFDDAAAYPTAGLEIIDLGRQEVQRFVTNKKIVLQSVAIKPVRECHQ